MAPSQALAMRRGLCLAKIVEPLGVWPLACFISSQSLGQVCNAVHVLNRSRGVMIRTDWEGTVGRRRLVANARPRMSMFTSQSLSVLGSRMAMHFERLVNRPLHRYSPFQGSTNLYNPATLPSCRPLYPRPSLSLIDFIPVLPPEPSTVL